MTTSRATGETGRYERRDAAPGAKVRSMDGARLGTVSEARGDSFKVHTGVFHKDYWLETALISSADEDRVVIGVLESEVQQYRLSQAIENNDALLDDAARDEQRRRMERELEQRQ